MRQVTQEQEQAIRKAEYALHQASFSEEAYAELLRLYLQSGRVAEAHEVYERLTERLALEGKSPSETVQELLQQESSVSHSLPARYVLSSAKERSRTRRVPIALATTLTAAGIVWVTSLSVLRPPTTSVSVPAAVQPLSLTSEAAGKMLAQATEEYHRGNFPRSEQLCREALAFFETTQEQERLLYGLRQLGETLQAQGDLRGAEQSFHRASLVRTGINNPAADANLAQLRGELAIEQGNYTAAETFLKQSLRFREKLDTSKPEARKEKVGGNLRSYVSLGKAYTERDILPRRNLYSEQNRFTEAENAFRLAMKLAESENDIPMQAAIRMEQGNLALQKRKHEEARSLLDASLSYWKSEGHSRWIATAQKLLAKVEFRDGNTAQAIALLTDSRTRYQAVGDVLRTAQTGVLLAGGLCVTDNLMGAKALLRESLPVLEKAGAERTLITFLSTVSQLASQEYQRRSSRVFSTKELMLLKECEVALVDFYSRPSSDASIPKALELARDYLKE